MGEMRRGVLEALVQGIVERLSSAFPFGPVMKGYKEEAAALLVKELKTLSHRLNIPTALVYHIRDRAPRMYTDDPTKRKARSVPVTFSWHLWNGFIPPGTKQAQTLCGRRYPLYKLERYSANRKDPPPGKVCGGCIRALDKRYPNHFPKGPISDVSEL